MKTKVLLTVDIEFSIAGAFADPNVNSPIGSQCVMGVIDGRSEGLRFVLETLKQNSLLATFFVEAMQTKYFGDEPMREVCRSLQDAGQDIQLHLHPAWDYLGQEGWKDRLAWETPNDDLDNHPVHRLLDWLNYGIDTFERWGIPRPIAFRSGSNRVDRNVYRAMSTAGIRFSSNISRGIFEPREPSLRLNGGMHVIEDVVEFPVTSYSSGFVWPLSRCRSLTITGTSLPELKRLFDRAHAQGSPVVTLLTHCHEFVRGDMRGVLEVNRINQERWAGLCQFLRESPDRFEVVPMRSFVQLGQPVPMHDELEIQLPIGMAIRRIMENKFNDYRLT